MDVTVPIHNALYSHLCSDIQTLSRAIPFYRHANTPPAPSHIPTFTPPHVTALSAKCNSTQILKFRTHHFSLFVCSHVLHTNVISRPHKADLTLNGLCGQFIILQNKHSLTNSPSHKTNILLSIHHFTKQTFCGQVIISQNKHFVVNSLVHKSRHSATNSPFHKTTILWSIHPFIKQIFCGQFIILQNKEPVANSSLHKTYILWSIHYFTK